MQQNSLSKLLKADIDPTWAFKGLGRKQTTYLTHGYHRYPAKFIPQIASRLIERYTEPNDLVVDPFGGCGTTLVEAKVRGRSSVVVDINPVARLIAKAKATPLSPVKLTNITFSLKKKFEGYNHDIEVTLPPYERIDYWFQPEQKRKLGFILNLISNLENKDERDFFYCGFSHILKNCSIWLQSSNKPTRDLKKKQVDPFAVFLKHIEKMMQSNKDLYDMLQKKGSSVNRSEVHCTDARTIPVQDGSATLVVTSPPYVTSYEYADLHQLTAFWFSYIENLSDFRKKFIGTSYHAKKSLTLHSQVAENIYQDLLKKHKKTAEGVATYFGEMYQVFEEMKRILKKEGRICIVIGDTKLKNVPIRNTEVFIEQLCGLGFEVDDIVKREILSKNLPSTRDPQTGRFTKIQNKNKSYIYPTEYILIMKKI